MKREVKVWLVIAFFLVSATIAGIVLTIQYNKTEPTPIQGFFGQEKIDINASPEPIPTITTFPPPDSGSSSNHIDWQQSPE